jgi:hypothetical protein
MGRFIPKGAGRSGRYRSEVKRGHKFSGKNAHRQIGVPGSF